MKENRRHYEDTQKQRYYERQVRSAKRQKAALEGTGASDTDIKAANTKIRQKQKDLRDYLAEHTDLARDYSREQIYTTDGAVKGTSSRK